MSEEYTITTVHNVDLKIPPDQHVRPPPECIQRRAAVENQPITQTPEIENVTVKIRISETDKIARTYPNWLTMSEIKQDLARKFEVDPKLLVLKYKNRVICNSVALHELCPDDFGIRELEVELIEHSENTNEGTTKLDLNVYFDKQRLPEFITVEIAAEDSEDGQPKSLIVEIQNQAIIKPFLCGYKDKRTGKEFLDAFTQTGPIFDKWKYRNYRSRDTQTFEHKEKILNTAHEQSSQCFLNGLNVQYVSSATDYTLTPGNYITFAQKERAEKRMEKILLIQRNWRRVVFWKYIRRRAAEYRQLVANREAEQKRFTECVEKRLEREEQVKNFPKTKSDFDLLYAEVEKWKKAEIKRITSMYEGPARISEMNILLDKEIQLLNGIDRQRRIVSKAMEDFRNEKFLEELGKPISWIGYNDCKVHMDLLRTQRVRFLTEVYKDLMKPLKVEERLELIRKVMELLLDYDCFEDFPELFDLFDREKNLLLYAKSADVTILRKRQNVLFFELIKTQKDPQKKRTASRMCIVCKKVKEYSQFAIRTRQTQVDTCKHCFYLKMASTESNVYESILRCVQREERKKRCTSSLAFVLQPDDIRHIIDQIWHGHSILSKSENLRDLRLPRWIISDDWSPWNCVCLTEKEARDHYRIEDITKVYDPKLILEVGNRHKLARSSFHTLAAVATEFQETGQWFKVGMNQQRSSNLK